MTVTVIGCGDEGAPVKDVQQALAAAGFSPGAIDGNFGPGTEAAVMAFQASEGLPVDGEIGSATAAKLGLAAGAFEPSPMPNITVSIVSQMFPQTHLDPIKQNLPPILAALEGQQLTWAPIVLAAIATLRAECEGFVPIDEYISRYNTSPGGHPFNLYDNRRDLGNRGAPDGASFKGRAYPQLTGLDNYVRIGKIIGRDLFNSPESANDPTISAEILAAFVKAEEAAMTAALRNGDLARARRLVNGGTLGLDKFVDAYRTGVSLLGLSPRLLGSYASV